MVKAEASKVTVAVATVVIFGTIAIFLYPAMYPLLAHWFSPETYGIYIGSARSGAGGRSRSRGQPDAENAAVIAKMPRVMMLAPFLMFIAARVKQLAPANNGEKSKITIPWFAIMFILVAVFNSFHLLPQSRGGHAGDAGYRPAGDGNGGAGSDHPRQRAEKSRGETLLMALMLFVWLIVGGGAINYAIHHLIGINLVRYSFLLSG